MTPAEFKTRFIALLPASPFSRRRDTLECWLHEIVMPPMVCGYQNAKSSLRSNESNQDVDGELSLARGLRASLARISI